VIVCSVKSSYYHRTIEIHAIWAAASFVHSISCNHWQYVKISRSSP
jgi:hypothetical protein